MNYEQSISRTSISKAHSAFWAFFMLIIRQPAERLS